MDPQNNNIFFWGRFLRFVKLDGISERNISYPTAQYFKKDGDLNPNMVWLLAKNRRHKMFIRRCADEIEPYEECLGNKYWYAL
jgi:hypothetical protein